jgi:hypothetical protein
MRRQFLRLFLLLVVALAAQRAAADKITLSNGRVIEGRILSRDASRVTIESGGMISKLSASSIQSIEKSAEYTNTLLGAETAFRRREPLKGFDALFSAQKQGAPTAELRRSIEQSSQGIRGGIENAREQDKPALRRSLRQLLEGDLLTTRTLFLTAQNFHRLDDWDSTAEALDRIAPDAIAADPMARKWTLDFMRGLVKRQLARGGFRDGDRVRGAHAAHHERRGGSADTTGAVDTFRGGARPQGLHAGLLDHRARPRSAGAGDRPEPGHLYDRGIEAVGRRHEALP